jgi:hypothetical protein
MSNARYGDKPITGLVIARFAEAMDISGAQAERLIQKMEPDYRMAVLETYGPVADRAAKTSEYFEDPDLIEMDRVSAELDAARARPVRGERPGYDPDVCTQCPGGPHRIGLSHGTRSMDACDEYDPLRSVRSQVQERSIEYR